MNDAPFAIEIVATSSERDLAAVRRGDEDVADLLGRAAKLRLEAHDEVEQLLALHHLRGGSAADRGLDESLTSPALRP